MTSDQVATTTTLGSPAEPHLPVPYRVTANRAETADTVTLRLEPVSTALAPFAAGQFTMLCKPGVGEIAISVSGDPTARDGAFTQTIRDVGAVSRTLTRSQPGVVIGMRGPFGRGWDVDRAAGQDLLIVAGGVGLAPLRPVLLSAVARRGDFGRVVLVAGARGPAEFLFTEQLAEWSADPGLEVLLTVDHPATGWDGQIGFVTEPLRVLELDPARTTAFVCGPEPMMRFTANLLMAKELPATSIQISLERNMQCGIGLCGHCQLGPLLVCQDGPVVDYERARPLLATKEL